VSIKAKDLENILRKVPASFDKVGIEFTKIEGDKPLGNVRIRIKTDDAQRQFIYNGTMPMNVTSQGYLLLNDISEYKQLLNKFGDNLRIRWPENEQIIFEDENGDVKKTAIILDDVKILDVNKIFPYQDGRVLYPKRDADNNVVRENGKPVMKPSDSFATLTVDEMKRALQDAIVSKHDYVSFHLVPGSSYSVSGKYDSKGTKATSKLTVDVGGSGDIDLPKSIDEFIKVVGDKGDTISIHFSDDFPVVTMVHQKESELIMYTIVKMNRPKPGDQ
jgi:hypothetical protein